MMFFTNFLSTTVFGSIECVNIPGCVLPPEFHARLLGQNRGVQGHQNSCYMDATLFSMFAFSTMFDSILHRPRWATCDNHYYDTVQRALREGIVNPLRKFVCSLFLAVSPRCCGSHVMRG